MDGQMGGWMSAYIDLYLFFIIISVGLQEACPSLFTFAKMECADCCIL